MRHAKHLRFTKEHIKHVRVKTYVKAMYMKNKITGQIIYILLIIETSKKMKEIFQYAYILVHVYFFLKH